MKHMVAAAVAVITLGAAVLPAGAQERPPPPVRSVECRAVDAERAFKVARATYQNAHDQVFGTTYQAHPGDGDTHMTPAHPEAALADLRDARRIALVAMEDALADWAYAEGWRIVSDRRLRAAKLRCDAVAGA